MRADHDALMKRLDVLERTSAKHGPDPARIYAPNLAGSHVRGPAQALVTLVAFSDFECSFCRAASATLEELRAHYGDQLRVVFMHHPLDMHARAVPAAVAAECAGEQGKFWEMHDRLFSLSSLEGQDFGSLGKTIGVADAPFDECRESERPKRVVGAHREQLRALSLKSAPVFFVNGHVLRGAASRAKFEALIDGGCSSSPSPTRWAAGTIPARTATHCSWIKRDERSSASMTTRCAICSSAREAIRT